MKKNIFAFILSVLFFVCCFTTLAYAQSDDDDEKVCLEANKDTIKATELTVEPRNIELAVGDQLQLRVKKVPENALLDTVVWSPFASESISLSSDGVFTANRVGYTDPFSCVQATSVLSNRGAFPPNEIKAYANYTYNGHIPEYVELAGEKWATSNVGADSPEEVGKYFMWGDRLGYTEDEFVDGNPLYEAGGYTSTNYENSPCGNGYSLTESFRPGDCEYDAATVNKGYHYVTPTANQLDSLINSDDVELVVIDGDWYRYERSDQKGLVIKKKGTNPTDGQFIFIPENYQRENMGFADDDVWYMINILSSTRRNSMCYYMRSLLYSKGGGKYPLYIGMGEPEPDQNPQQKIITSYGGWYAKPIRPIYRECNQPFSVSATKYVEFSTGNAQFNSSSSTWRFAPTQYSIIGNTTSDWTDLHLYNANYSSLGSEWYMLTNTEWNYLLSGRANASALRSAATVYGVPGLIILPDTWVWPKKIAAEKQWETGSNNTSSYSFSTDWDEMEEAGAIFLPIAGWAEYKGGKSTYKDANKGFYWTNTTKDANNAYYLQLVSGNNPNANNASKIAESKYSIRLVKDL